MGLSLSSAPAIEPITVTELRNHLRLDTTDGEIAPDAPTAALAGAQAGNVDDGVHRYRVTFVTADGETEGGSISNAVTVADNSSDGQVSLSAIPTGGSYVTARKIYRTEADGSDYLLLTTISNNTTTTYTDNTADSGLGASAPTTNTTEDPLLTSLITSARVQAEDMTKRKFITQTWVYYIDAFPCRSWFEIPIPPLQSLTSIQYTHTDGATQTFSSSKYHVSTSRDRARVMLNEGESWPDTDPVLDAVQVTIVVGYGHSRSDVPEPIKQAMKLMAGHWYNQREDVVFGVVGTNVPNTSEMLLAPYMSREF